MQNTDGARRKQCLDWLVKKRLIEMVGENVRLTARGLYASSALLENDEFRKWYADMAKEGVPDAKIRIHLLVEVTSLGVGYGQISL